MKREKKQLMEQKVNMEKQDNQDYKVTWDTQDHKVLMERKMNEEKKDNQEMMDRKVNQD